MDKVNRVLIQKLIDFINDININEIRIMEVCGTHTHQIARLGIRKLLSTKIHLVSGPGCPICITEAAYINAAIKLLERKDVIIVTFGDMLRVKGTECSLMEQKASGKNVVVVYSPEDILTMAINNKDKEIVFLAVGFETTAPLFASIIKTAKMREIKNLFLFTSLKVMEPIIRFILEEHKVCIDGMICPGNVASITGTSPFKVVTERHHIPAVICGFEAIDILMGIGNIVNQIAGKRTAELINLYKRCVVENGNGKALNIMNEVFTVSDSVLRGIGSVKESSLILNKDYESYDVTKRFNMQIDSTNISEMCECSDILLGLKEPYRCINFAKGCTPENPMGPCMISSEGSCAAYYRYGRY